MNIIKIHLNHLEHAGEIIPTIIQYQISKITYPFISFPGLIPES